MCERFAVGRSQLDVTSNTWLGPNSQTLHAAEIKFHTRRGEQSGEDFKKCNFSGFVAFLNIFRVYQLEDRGVDEKGDKS